MNTNDQKRALLGDMSLRRASLDRAHLKGVILDGADLSEADLSSANLIGANLTGANLSGARLDSAKLIGAKMQGANLGGANLRGADLTVANLSDAILVGAKLRRGNLTGTQLYRADLRRARLIEADLSVAKLDGANLREANLGRARLRGASLSGANLRGADLTEADLTEADLSRARFVDSQGSDGPHLHGARMHDIQITNEREGGSSGAFLELAMVDSLDRANFGNTLFLPDYLSRALPFALERERSLGTGSTSSSGADGAIDRIQAVQTLYGDQQPPAQLVVIAKLINGELRAHLKNHPHRLEARQPRLFDEPIVDFLTNEGWTVQLAPEVHGGDSDLFAIARQIAGKPSAWILDCKKHPSTNRAGIEIVRDLYGITAPMKTGGTMLATTLQFAGQGPATKDNNPRPQRRRASRYGLDLPVYSEILEWINEVRPNPAGHLHLREGLLTIDAR